VTAGHPAALAHAMHHPAAAALAGVLILATAVWAGGLVTILVAARVASGVLQPAQRVAFFRGLGCAYLPVGGLLSWSRWPPGRSCCTDYRRADS
jgi:hypothetical protein